MQVGRLRGTSTRGPQSAKTRLMVKIFKVVFLAQNSSLGLVDDAQSENICNSRNTCLKIGYILGVSEIMDLGQEACLIKLYASEPCNRPCVNA